MKAGEFAARLAIERTKKGFTQSEMADHLEVSLRSYTSWESGKKLPKKTTRIHIAQKLEYEADYFLTDEELNVDFSSTDTTENEATQNYSLTSGGVSAQKRESVDRMLGDLRERLLNGNADEELLLSCLEQIENTLNSKKK